MIKKILKIVSLVLLGLTLTLSIITLVNYYQYVNLLDKLTTESLTLLEKFELQETKDTYLYRALKMLLWNCYTAIVTVLTCVTTVILTHIKSEPKKIR